MVYKIVYNKGTAGHVHARLWSGTAVGKLALAGNLVMADEEFSNFRKMLEAGSGLMDSVIFERQVTSGPATRVSNGFRPA